MEYRPFQPGPDPATLAIESFGSLAPGWHYGSGGPASGDVRGRAHKAVERLLLVGFTKIDAFPGADGEILVAGYMGKNYVAITAEPDGRYTFNHECGDEDLAFEEGLNLSRVIKLLNAAAEKIWGISVLSTQGTSITLESSLETWHSRSQLMAECQFSSTSVPKLEAA